MTALRGALAVAWLPIAFFLTGDRAERTVTVGLVLVYVAVSVAAALAIRRRRWLALVGWGGAVFDVVVLAGLAVIFRSGLLVDAPGAPEGLSLKTSLPLIALLFVTVSALAFRPAYPLIVASGSLVILLVLGMRAWLDPQTVFTADYFTASAGPEVSIGRYVSMLVVIAGAGLVLGRLAGNARRMTLEAASLERTATLLGRYFSPTLLPRLSADPRLMTPGGERRELSFVFTDLEGFTGLVESLDPVRLVPILNQYLDGLTRIAFRHEGTVDKFVGDAVHVIFGAPLDQPDHADRALACALEMDAFAVAFAAERAGGLGWGRTRIGVNSGIAVVGNFGGEALFDYTAHGDAINTAARLEEANRTLGTRICVSEETVRRADRFRGRVIGRLRLRGKRIRLLVYEPCGAQVSDERLARYAEALAAAESGDLPRAIGGLRALADDDGDDPLVSLYLRRCLDGVGGVDLESAEAPRNENRGGA